MSDATPNAPATPPDAKKNGSVVGGLVVPALLILAAGVVFGVFYFLNPKAPPRKVLNGYAVAAEKYGTLDQKFTDKDGDLIADTPADAKPPKELYFCEVPGANPTKDEETWKAFLAHMTRETGLPCKYLKKVKQVDPPPGFGANPPPGEEGRPVEELGLVTSFGSQLNALAEGQLHVTAFTTGQVRQAVNTAGFRPLVVPADKDDKYKYQVQVLVPASSPAKTLADLRGKKLAVSGMSSHSSAKAPFVHLYDEHKMLPEADYAVLLPGRYELALAQLLKGEVDALCVASDLLKRSNLSDEDTKKYRVLHTFGEYPKVCFGVSNKLPEELVKKIVSGFKSFPFDGPVGDKYKADGAVKFHQIDYKTDWETVRQVDDRLAEIAKAEAAKGK